MDKKPLLFGCGGLLIAAIVALVVIGGWAASVNNRLVGLDESRKAAWAQVETVLQRRYDLIPNLVATVKGYATHEKETFENIARLRSQWSAATTVEEKAKTATEMEGALSRLLVVAENYPELKASQNFQNLQVELAGTENKVGFARQFYNDIATRFNMRQQVFPMNLVAGPFGFKPAELFEVTNAAERDVPIVDLSRK